MGHFVGSLLTVDPEKRPNVSAALEHPWIRANGDPEPVVESALFEKMMHFANLPWGAFGSTSAGRRCWGEATSALTAGVRGPFLYTFPALFAYSCTTCKREATFFEFAVNILAFFASFCCGSRGSQSAEVTQLK